MSCSFVSEYTFYIKSLSYDKESLVLIIIQPTFTDIISSWSIDTIIDNPTVLTLNLQTKSGTGKKHRVILKADNFEEKKITTKFRLSQAFTYSSLREGEFYIIEVTAFSGGDRPWIREYTYVESTYPAHVQLHPISPQPQDVQTSTLTWQFCSEGVKHQWVLSLVLPGSFFFLKNQYFSKIFKKIQKNIKIVEHMLKNASNCRAFSTKWRASFFAAAFLHTIFFGETLVFLNVLSFRRIFWFLFFVFKFPTFWTIDLHESFASLLLEIYWYSSFLSFRVFLLNRRSLFYTLWLDLVCDPKTDTYLKV